MNGKETAVKILGPLVAEVSDWVDGKGTARPKVLSLLPNELQSEVALQRLKARRAAGLEPPEQLEAASQQSRLVVTTGPVPES